MMNEIIEKARRRPKTGQLEQPLHFNQQSPGLRKGEGTHELQLLTQRGLSFSANRPFLKITCGFGGVGAHFVGTGA